MMKPENRPKELEAVSDEHYEMLLFGWRVAEGLRKQVKPERIKAYADWFFEHYLIPHFRIEEKYVFPIIGLKKVRVRRALANHRRMIRLFQNEKDVFLSLNRIEEEIGAFIRFEERVILKQVQSKATPEELALIERKHEEIHVAENTWTDKFWENPDRSL